MHRFAVSQVWWGELWVSKLESIVGFCGIAGDTSWRIEEEKVECSSCGIINRYVVAGDDFSRGYQGLTIEMRLASFLFKNLPTSAHDCLTEPLEMPASNH